MGRWDSGPIVWEKVFETSQLNDFPHGFNQMVGLVKAGPYVICLVQETRNFETPDPIPPGGSVLGVTRRRSWAEIIFKCYRSQQDGRIGTWDHISNYPDVVPEPGLTGDIFGSAHNRGMVYVPSHGPDGTIYANVLVHITDIRSTLPPFDILQEARWVTGVIQSENYGDTWEEIYVERFFASELTDMAYNPVHDMLRSVGFGFRSLSAITPIPPNPVEFPWARQDFSPMSISLGINGHVTTGIHVWGLTAVNHYGVESPLWLVTNRLDVELYTENDVEFYNGTVWIGGPAGMPKETGGQTLDFPYESSLDEGEEFGYPSGLGLPSGDIAFYHRYRTKADEIPPSIVWSLHPLEYSKYFYWEPRQLLEPVSDTPIFHAISGGQIGTLGTLQIGNPDKRAFFSWEYRDDQLPDKHPPVYFMGDTANFRENIIAPKVAFAAYPTPPYPLPINVPVIDGGHIGFAGDTGTGPLAKKALSIVATLYYPFVASTDAVSGYGTLYVGQVLSLAGVPTQIVVQDLNAWSSTGVLVDQEDDGPVSLSANNDHPEDPGGQPIIGTQRSYPYGVIRSHDGGRTWSRVTGIMYEHTAYIGHDTFIAQTAFWEDTDPSRTPWILSVDNGAVWNVRGVWKAPSDQYVENWDVHGTSGTGQATVVLQETILTPEQALLSGGDVQRYQWDPLPAISSVAIWRGEIGPPEINIDEPPTVIVFTPVADVTPPKPPPLPTTTRPPVRRDRPPSAAGGRIRVQPPRDLRPDVPPQQPYGPPPRPHVADTKFPGRLKGRLKPKGLR